MTVPISTASSVATLRAITYRLSSTPTKQLPSITPQIASQLWNCKDLLASTAASTKQGNEAATIVHRFRTHLSTLLQDRTIEGRWAAVVLTKATIEAGGVEVLSKSNAWVRSLLGILKKPDPPTTRNLAVITLTRIFTLTWDYTNLVREITTPALSSFISTCLSNADNKRCSARELQTVLEALATLLPRHPTIFRTNEGPLRSLLLRIISCTSSYAEATVHYTSENRDVAQRLLVLLHHCSPKQGAADKWDETLKATVLAAHSTCDSVFRSVIEDWKSVAGVSALSNSNALLQGDAETEENDAVGFSGWKGIFAGSERLVSLLQLLKTHIESATAGAVTVRIGIVVDLVTRLLTLRSPSAKGGVPKSNPQISKDERDALFIVLPSVHVAVFRLIDVVMSRFENALASIVQSLLPMVCWVFEAELSDCGLRVASYMLLKRVLELQGPSLAKEDVTDVEPIIKACCHDLLPYEQSSSGANTKQIPAPSDLGIQAAKVAPSHATRLVELQVAASLLLPMCFSKLNATRIPGRLRTLMERTAVLVQHKDALIACVLNPTGGAARGKTQASLLPLLARLYPDAAEVEALLRPRMPVIRSGRPAPEDYEVDGYEENDLANGVANGRSAQHSIDEDEPTAGLLNALGQQDGGEDSEDLYSASPKRQASSGALDAAHAQTGSLSRHDVLQTSDKRVANEVPDTDRAAKRLRASPVAETLMPSAAGSLYGSDPMLAQSIMPATVHVEQPPSSFVTAPEPSQQIMTLPAAPAAAGPSANAGDTVDVDSDGSDFEMPPLTMDPSDDDEEEEGEE